MNLWRSVINYFWSIHGIFILGMFIHLFIFLFFFWGGQKNILFKSDLLPFYKNCSDWKQIPGEIVKHGKCAPLYQTMLNAITI